MSAKPALPTFGTTSLPIVMWPPLQGLIDDGTIDETTAMMLVMGLLPPEVIPGYQDRAVTVPSGTAFQVDEECDCGNDCGVLATFTTGPLEGQQVVLYSEQVNPLEPVQPLSDDDLSRLLSEWDGSFDPDEE